MGPQRRLTLCCTNNATQNGGQFVEGRGLVDECLGPSQLHMSCKNLLIYCEPGGLASYIWITALYQCSHTTEPTISFALSKSSSISWS